MYVILFCDVIFSPLPTAPRGWGRKTTPWVGLKTVHVHDTGTSGVMTSLPVGKNAANLHAFTIMTSLPVCDVTSVPGPSIHNYSCSVKINFEIELLSETLHVGLTWQIMYHTKISSQSNKYKYTMCKTGHHFVIRV